MPLRPVGSPSQRRMPDIHPSNTAENGNRHDSICRTLMDMHKYMKFTYKSLLLPVAFEEYFLHHLTDDMTEDIVGLLYPRGDRGGDGKDIIRF
jgi:hypothetical protein